MLKGNKNLKMKENENLEKKTVRKFKSGKNENLEKYERMKI